MKKLFIILLTANIFYPSLAQNLDPILETFQDTEWNFKVKQLEDFFNRFNNRLTYQQNDQKLSFEFSEDSYRQLLMTTIESQDTLLTKKFIDQIIIFQKSNQLSFLDSGWYAEAQIDFSYLEKKNQINLILKVVEADSIGHSWGICGIKKITAPLYEYTANPDKFINPANHNLRFSNLRLLFDGKSDFGGLLSHPLEINQESLFLFLAGTGQLKFNQVKSLRYHFTQFPDYIFVVENFDRTGIKSGWLISDIFQANSQQKEKYLRNLILESHAN